MPPGKTTGGGCKKFHAPPARRGVTGTRFARRRFCLLRDAWRSRAGQRCDSHSELDGFHPRTGMPTNARRSQQKTPPPTVKANEIKVSTNQRAGPKDAKPNDTRWRARIYPAKGTNKFAIKSAFASQCVCSASAQRTAAARISCKANTNRTFFVQRINTTDSKSPCASSAPWPAGSVEGKGWRTATTMAG